MAASVKQVICINWGTKYGPDYVNRLYGMVARNITPPFTFTCFTDSEEGIRDEVDCQPLPEIAVEIPKTRRGIWPKARLWGEKLGTLEGNVLFLDLDLVVTGSLDRFFTYGGPDKVIMARNPVRPLERLGQTSVYRFPVGKMKPMQDMFCANPTEIAEKYVWEQRFVTRNAPGGVEFFPSSYVRHFRHHCAPPFPINFLVAPRLPRDTSVVIFPGALNPPVAITGGWNDRPGMPLAEHFRTAFSRWRKPRAAFRHLKHYLKPAPWVADYWTE